ncbi:hypothetical protein FR773_18155 [Leclercia adecarboxylata]|nr:hypothetical protein FR819_19540 [Leclercia adecarboxylata]QFH66505.1 hypothetical protein FR773_18155 [Leclercia adecarboxylata]QIG34555.1 hypothetical protein FY047_18675 [Leclercia adecarboxylata]
MFSFIHTYLVINGLKRNLCGEPFLKHMNRCFQFVKHRFNLFYCDLNPRHSINSGNVIAVETAFQ